MTIKHESGMSKGMKLGIFVSSLFFVSCADVTRPGRKVHFIEIEDGKAFQMQEKADKMVAHNGCRFVGWLDAKTSKFPGSYSIHENEIHAALRNRAAKLGANLVIANFYQKPAQGIGLDCPESVLTLHD